MGLPSPASLKLSEAVAFVTERCNCSEDEAKDALRRAARDSQLEAEGDIPLSAHRDPVVRERHPVRKRERLGAADWSGYIDWGAATVGRYFSVSIKRSSLDAWLNTGAESPSVPTGQTRPLAAKRAETFVNEYIEQEKLASRTPTLKGVEKAARDAGFTGGREFLRTAFRKAQTACGIPVKRGRIKKSPENSPKK
jgi:hypothetical protein